MTGKRRRPTEPTTQVRGLGIHLDIAVVGDHATGIEIPNQSLVKLRAEVSQDRFHSFWTDARDVG